MAAGLAALTLAALTLAAAPAAWAAGQGDDQTVDKLKDFSLEDLTNLTVTSVSKHAEPLSQAPASVFVITAEDIRRSGATSLPEALRLAPNLEVARINAGQYAITARGGNSAESSNKLLVLINGRSVYEPIGSGVLWQQVDVPVASIVRIEVISGPGGTLWGANAVNGVINVITGAPGPDGLKLDVGGGDLERNGAATLSGHLGGLGVHATVSAFDRQGLDRAPGDTTDDGIRGVMGNLRLEGGGDGGAAAYSLSFKAYDNHEDLNDGRLWGGDVTGHLGKTLANGSQIEALAYVATDDRSDLNTHERRDTFNVQVQDSLALGDHQLVVGGEARLWREYFLSTNIFQFANPRANIGLGAVFAQDVVALRPDLKLTLGLKLEDNSYSGMDWMPNVRLAWTPGGGGALLWAAFSRAVRTPNRIERELQASGILVPSPDFQSESLLSYELGYRGEFSSRASLSLTAYYDIYDDLRTDQTNGAAVLPIILRNGAQGHAYGLEAWGTFTLTDWWRLRAGANTLQRDYQLKPGQDDLTGLQIAGIDPTYQAQLRSDMTLTPNVDLNLALRRVGRTATVLGFDSAPAYTEADARLAWRVRPGLELSLSGFNLLNPRHMEIDDASTAPIRFIPRSVYVGLRWGF
ncbi:TonB-dependent receptor plug domain-containing protein [Phenylobacterium sp.]|jgi:iron complex outermembrane receptor protein|uniref:TonB-dependent receptor plug domain-containing protein n=1 Tax=Phenylobacterium sp. TaxID=1871053 RepID=UPI002F40E1B3